MMKKVKTLEADMLEPVLRLFPQSLYNRFPEVSLGRKKIDLLCVPKGRVNASAAVELKLANWRRALWQALNNFQLADQSYVAIWHENLHRVEDHLDLFELYGIGLIGVKPRNARFIRTSRDRVFRIAREQKREFYRHLVGQV
jgi:hypothetical protein